MLEYLRIYFTCWFWYSLTILHIVGSYTIPSKTYWGLHVISSTVCSTAYVRPHLVFIYGHFETAWINSNVRMILTNDLMHYIHDMWRCFEIVVFFSVAQTKIRFGHDSFRMCFLSDLLPIRPTRRIHYEVFPPTLPRHSKWYIVYT